jgi:hypothetical protein
MANVKQKFPMTILRHGRRIEMPILYDPDWVAPGEEKLPMPPPEPS